MTTLTTDIASVTPSGGPVATPVAKPARGRRRFRFLANGKAATGVTMFAIFIVFAIIGPWITPYDPGKLSTDALLSPSGKHWFGTTHIGQDIFSQLLAGTRSVIYVGLLAGLVATALSIIIGVTAGYLGGTADEGLSALSNVFLVIPALPLIIIITSTVKSAGDTTVALVIGFTSWAWGARILRAQTLSLRRRDYVEAARATGESTWRIVFFEILPNLTAIIASGFVGTVIFAVTSEITLAFIGISSTSGWNWGTILYWAQSQQALAAGYWWWFIPPGLAIALLGTSLALINFGIDEFVSPRLRNSGKTKVKMANGHTVRMRFGFTPVLRQASDGTAIEGSPIEGSGRSGDTINFGATAPAPRSGNAAKGAGGRDAGNERPGSGPRTNNSPRGGKDGNR